MLAFRQNKKKPKTRYRYPIVVHFWYLSQSPDNQYDTLLAFHKECIREELSNKITTKGILQLRNVNFYKAVSKFFFKVGNTCINEILIWGTLKFHYKFQPEDSYCEVVVRQLGKPRL